MDLEMTTPARSQTGVGFFALREGRCKYPLGGIAEPASRFCGAAAPAGCPYCAAHAAIAFQPRPDRGGRTAGAVRR